MKRRCKPGGHVVVDIGIEPDPDSANPITREMAQHAGENGELTLRFECSVSPYDPGQSFGADSDYPPEGGEVEWTEAFIVREDGKVSDAPQAWVDELEKSIHVTEMIEERAREQVAGGCDPEPPDDDDFDEDREVEWESRD